MPDISMCENVSCPSRRKCYRYMAKPNSYWQAYSSFKPIDGDRLCFDFIDVKGYSLRALKTISEVKVLENQEVE